MCSDLPFPYARALPVILKSLHPLLVDEDFTCSVANAQLS